MRLSLRPWGEVLSPPFCVRGGSLARRCPGGGQRRGGRSAHLAGPPVPPAACPALCPRAGPGSPVVTRWAPGPRLNRGCRVLSPLPRQYTLNGKKVEVAVKRVIAGEPAENYAALSNPETLDWYRHVPELQGF